MTVMDLKIALDKFPNGMRVMVDVPHMGEMFKFVDLVECEKIEIDNEDNTKEEIIMLSPFEMNLSDN